MAETAPVSGKRRDLKMSKIVGAVKSEESDVTGKGQAVELQGQRKVNEGVGGCGEGGKEQVLIGKVELKVEAECNDIRKDEIQKEKEVDGDGGVKEEI